MISVCLPTRGRPENMRELVESMAATATDKVEVVFYIDEDDVDSRKALPKLIRLSPKVTVRRVIGPRITMSDTYNKCAKRATGDILMECCDAVLFRSQGWDTRVERTFDQYADRIVLVYGKDGIHNGGAAALPFLHRRWVDTVGYFMPPYFSADWCDTWVTEVAQSLRRMVYLDDVFTQHRHPVAGTAPMDQTYLERVHRANTDRVVELYQSLADERKADAEKLRKVMA